MTNAVDLVRLEWYHASALFSVEEKLFTNVSTAFTSEIVEGVALERTAVVNQILVDCGSVWRYLPWIPRRVAATVGVVED